MSRLITDASDYRFVMADGFTWLVWELDPDGVIRLTTREGNSPSDSEPVSGSTHSTKTIADLILALSGMVGRAERQ